MLKKIDLMFDCYNKLFTFNIIINFNQKYNAKNERSQR